MSILRRLLWGIGILVTTALFAFGYYAILESLSK